MVPRDSGDDIKRGRDAVATAEGGRARSSGDGQDSLCVERQKVDRRHSTSVVKVDARHRCESLSSRIDTDAKSTVYYPGICLDLGFASRKKSLFSERLSERPTSACFGTCGKNVSSVPVSTCNHDLVRSDMHLSQHNAKRWRATAAYVRRANRPRRSYSSPRGVVSGCLFVSDCGGATASASDPRGPAPADSPHATHIRLRFRGVTTYVAEQARRLGISGPDSKHVGLGSREGHGRCAPQHAPREPLAQPRLVGMGILPRGAGQVHARLRRGAEQRR